MKNLLLILLTTALGASMPVNATAADGAPRVTFITPDIVRIQWSADSIIEDNATGVCVYGNTSCTADVRNTPAARVYSSKNLVVEIDKSTTALTFRDAHTGRALLSEDAHMPRRAHTTFIEDIVYDEASARIEDTANGKVTVRDIVRRDTTGRATAYAVSFDFSADEGLYGLGSHMENYMNLNGKTLYLTQHNLKVTVPVIVSTNGYGLLFDAGCAMKFDNGSVEFDAARSLDYYFIKGDSFDNVIAGYRFLTGPVSMMPRYAFGYIQSKERYTSSADIIATLAEYRRRHIPLDMMVQDWNYWPEGWGYMKMDRRFYPDPKALADSVHGMHARLMVSIWPNPQACPQERDFKERGFMLSGSVYNAFDPEARKYYWQYANDEFFSNGFDAWWCDSSEPIDADWNRAPSTPDGHPYGRDDHELRWHLNKDALSAALGSERSSLYSLYHARGIYENQRAATSSKRVVNLTRSGYAGQQRYGTIVWNGDTYASWQSFKQQIPAGLNYMAAGCPYWTVDIGGFFTRSDGRWFYKGEFPDGVDDDAFREYYTRMLQWAAFLPVFRSHGTDTPREVWRFGEPGSPYYDAILDAIRLRYSLLPHIYSMAAAQTRHGYTMARMLSFDFPADTTVRDIKDQYMFGHILVCPVTDPGVRTRRVYLPAADGAEPEWYDFHTGRTYRPGQWIDAETGIDRMPLFVRGGSIIITTEPLEYADAQIGRPVTVTVYPGRDTSFEFYEDAGDGYAFEHGESVTIPLLWNNESRTLLIGAQTGDYPGHPSQRSFAIKTPWAEKSIRYDGKPVKITL